MLIPPTVKREVPSLAMFRPDPAPPGLFALPLPVRPNYHDHACALERITIPRVADFFSFIELLIFPARLIASTVPQKRGLIV